MRRLFGSILLLGFVLACSADLAPEDVIGSWRITDVYCAGCQVQDRSDLGKVIELGKSRVRDPLSGGGCERDIGYRRIGPPASESKELLGKVSRTWSTGKQVQFVAVTCGGLDLVTLAQLADGSLVYLMEGDISFLMAKQ